MVVDRPSAVDVAGADRVRFLNAYVTCDVRLATAQRRVPGFVTSREGRVLLPVGIVARDESLRVDVPEGAAGTLVDHLQRFIIADRVSVTAVQQPGWRVVGDDADGADDVAAEWLGVPTRLVWADDPAAATVATLPLGTLDPERVVAGRVRFGVDYTAAECFPQELGAEGEAGVSYEKGCYLGQEIVARIHWRGRPQRETCRLELSGNPSVGVELMLDDRPVGTLTSVAGDLGLAIVHRRAEPGARLVVGSGTALVLGPT